MSIARQAVPSVPPFRARLLAHPVLRIVLGVLAVMLPVMLTMMLTDILIPKPLRVVWPMLLAATLSLLSYRWFTRRLEQRQASELALAGAAREAGIGVALGAALGLLVAGLLAAAGAFSVTGTAINGNWGFLLKSLPEHIMVACFEELMFRAVLFRIVEQRWGTRSALVVSFVMFALAHLPNDHISAVGVLNTGVASLTLCGCYLLTRRLWLAIGMHFGWNYLYDGIFAVPLSGHTPHGWIQVAMSGPDWLSGGAYGVEASAATLLAWGVAAAVMLRRPLKR